MRQLTYTVGYRASILCAENHEEDGNIVNELNETVCVLYFAR